MCLSCLFLSILFFNEGFSSGILGVLADSVIMLFGYFYNIRSQAQQFKLEGDKPEKLSPKTAVRKTWASKSFSETPV